MPNNKKVFQLLMGVVLSILNFGHVFAAEYYEPLSLIQAVDIGLVNNTEKTISYQAFAIAESQYQEALSARWPTVSMQGSYQHRDEPPNFVFPSSSIPLGGLAGALQTVAFSTAQQQALGMGATVSQAAQAGAAASAQIPSNITVPQQNVKLFNQNTTIASIQLMYPLYTGGKISSLISQAGFGKAIANEEMRRSSMQVVRDVKRFYYAAQLTQRLTETAHDTLGLLEVTRDLTKTLYEGGSNNINKLDYLKTQMAVSYAKSVEADFSAKHKSALAALVNAMGLSWDAKIKPVDDMNIKVAANPELEALVRQASEFNPQLGQLKLAVKAANAKIGEAYSGHLPQVAITADATRIYNAYDAGLTSDVNKNSWTIGIGVSMPLFDGWRTSSQVNTIKLQYAQMQEKQKLVEQGIAALVKNLFIEFDSAREQVAISEQARKISEENRDLTSRAFQIGASKPQDVIEANILYAIVQGNLLRSQHDQLLKLAEIDYVLGAEAE
ncbi:MAG: TolC family protein [Methylotenera sp.]|nr:TolC family protein [Methylotenera sp.]